MTIKTKPVFYYIGPVDTTNYLLNFREPNQTGIELTAILNAGSRSMSDLLTEVTRALNASGENTYSTSLDRDTRIVTISADDEFELLVSSGSNSGLSIFSAIGFTGADRTAAMTYEGNTAMGNEYSPQTVPQDFIAFENNKEGILSTVNESASGVVEVVTFGTRSFMEMNIKWITDREMMQGKFIEDNPNAVQEARDFLTFCISKSDFEFMIDKNNRSTYEKVLLESTKKDRNGNSFELTEMLRRGLEEYYETGKLRFRQVI